LGIVIFLGQLEVRSISSIEKYVTVHHPILRKEK